jgi:hypothetical protein
MLSIGLLLAMAAAAGCSHEQAPPTAAGTTPTYGMATDTAVSNIARTRCNHELTCNQVGKGMEYDSFEVCTHEVARDASTTLHDQACPNGVKDTQLSSCLMDLQKQACENPVESIDRIGSCNKSSLCI